MADESLRFDIIGRDNASGAFSRVGGSVKDMGDRMNIATKSALILDDALKRQHTAARVSADASLALAKADDILVEAEHALRDGALEAEFALKKETEAKKKSGDAALEAAAKNKAFRDSLNSKASSAQGFGPALLGPALLAAPVAASVAGVGAGAAIGLGGAFAASAIALASFGAVAKPVLSGALAAEQAVQKAQDNYNVAIANGTNQAKAYKAEQIAIGKAYAELSPAQIQLSKQLGDMAGKWQDIKASFTPMVSSALQPWLKGITVAMESLGSVIKPMGPVIHDLGVAFATLTTSSTFRTFAAWVGTTGAAVTRSAGGAVLDLITGITFLLPQFTPLIKGASDGIKRWGDAFVKWSASQKAADQIHSFLDWFHKNGPVVGQLVKNMGAALAALAPGIGTASIGELNVISSFFAFIAKLPPGLAKPLVEVAGALLLLNKLGVVSVGVKLTGVVAGKFAETALGKALVGGAGSLILPVTLTVAALTGLSMIKDKKGGGSLLAPKASDLGFNGTWAHDIAHWFDVARHEISGIWDLTWNNTVGRARRGVDDAFKQLGVMRHNFAGSFDQIRHDSSHSWDLMWNNTVGRARRGADDVFKQVSDLRHNTASTFDTSRHEVSHIWDLSWNNTVGRAGRGISDVGTAIKKGWDWIVNNVWNPVRNFMTSTVPGWFNSAVGSIGRFWSGLGDKIRQPVAWVIDKVLNGLISAFDWVTSHVGLGNPISHVHPMGLARGGKVPGGYGGGDIMPILAEPGEAVVDKQRSRRYAPVLAAMGVPGFASGGVVGNSASFPGGRGGVLGAGNPTGTPGFISKAADLAKITAAFATGNATAAGNAFGALFGHGTGGAGGELGSVLEKVPSVLAGDVVKWLLGKLAGSGNSIVQYAKTFMGKIPYVFGGTSLSPAGADCCLQWNMRVLTTRGPKQIIDIVPGDEVWTWDDGKPRASRVTYRSKPRPQMTYRLRTLHREITASGNHPFLTLRKVGRCAPPEPRYPEREKLVRPYNRRARQPVTSDEVRDLYLAGASLSETAGMLGISIGTVVNRLNESGTPRRAAGSGPGTSGRPPHSVRNGWALSWVNLEDLRRGDLIITLKSLPDDNPAPDDEYLSDPEFLWLLGFAIGDGHLRKDRPNGVSLCVFGDDRDMVQRRLTAYCGKPGTPEPSHGIRLHDARLAEGLRRYGLGRRSTDREVPPEIWSLPHSHIQAFLDGYTAADGSIPSSTQTDYPSLRYGAASEILIRGIRDLHMILGHNVSRVRETKRTKPIVIRGREVKNARSLWIFEAYTTGLKLATGGITQLRTNADVADLFPADSHFAPQRVTSIEPAATEDTYDITVDDTHNFVAEGLVVHNSGFTGSVYKHFGYNPPRTSEEQFGWVKRGSPQPGGLAFFNSPAGGPPPGHVAIVMNGQTTISQGGGMGPTFGSMAGNMGTGIPPSGFTSGVGAGSAGVGNLIANAGAIGAYLLSHGASKIGAAGIMGNMLQESGGNWNIGGGGLIQITGASPSSLGDSLAQTISYINANGGMGPINAAYSVAQATELFMNQYERPAPATENLARRLAGANAAYAAGYDQGGFLPPGLSLAYNGTGYPEPVGPARGGGNTYHITVNVPPGANMAEAGRVTVATIREYEKRSGKSWRS